MEKSSGGASLGRRKVNVQLRALCVVAAVLSAALCGCISIGFKEQRISTVTVERSGRFFEPNRIAIIDIDGFIGSGSAPWWMIGGTSVAEVKEKLERARWDRRVQAVVLRVNSPGGEVGASDIIYEELQRFRRETGKPVVACCMDVAASGGYYVACGTDRIVASPTTVTGSVGVIMHLTNVEGLFGKIGLQSVTIKSGAKKDIGSPTRMMTAEEREIMERLMQGMFKRFVGVMRTAHPAVTDADAAIIGDGRVFGADEALQLHMIDRIGYLRDAIEEAASLARISAADVILYQKVPAATSNIYAQWGPAMALGEGLNALLRRQGPAFLYLWTPAQ